MRQLLDHLRNVGFPGAPRPLGTDEHGRDVFSYIEGHVGHYPWTPEVASRHALASAARLLRDYHDATAESVHQWRDGWRWAAREPVEVVCHNDFAPYNCVFTGEHAVAVIDFDTAGPGPRSWDIAYALYRFAPLSRHDDDPHPEDTAQYQGERARDFLDAYGAASTLREASILQVVPRLRTLITFMQSAAAAGDTEFARHLTKGHAAVYLRDAEYVQSHSNTWISYVTARR
ncbi:phosphotransferase enzyme family protein [Streptomyces tendae]|uniref:phosphotransferase enzyme family protein n=1 Tax=Streptomyces tendae TaxID=1932 RepID=UPI003660583D